MWIYFTEVRDVQMVERGGLCFVRTLISERLDQAKVRAMETVLPPPPVNSQVLGGHKVTERGPKWDNCYLKIGLNFFQITDLFI